jgi:hypothetical protein
MSTRKCNKCHKEKHTGKFRYGKRTCRKCEYRWWQRVLRYLVKQRKLSPIERLANRLGYMGTGFIMSSPYLLQYDNIGTPFHSNIHAIWIPTRVVLLTYAIRPPATVHKYGAHHMVRPAQKIKN